jgi:hypothetical protein
VSPEPHQNYPPIIRTSDPESFAAFTLRHRLPGIIDQIIAKNRLNQGEAEGLRALQQRLLSGTVEQTLSTHPYLADWMEPESLATWRGEIEEHVGISWLDLPWYFAESLFYLEVLLAWGYYRPESPHFFVDPFRPVKQEEIERPGGALDLAAHITGEIGGTAEAEEILPALLQACLWANRLDLSYSRLHERYREQPQGKSEELLVDHSGKATERLLRAEKIDIILDNSASELIADLILVHTLLQHAHDLEVVMHCKQVPYYVSDATIDDVRRTIGSLQDSTRPELARLGRALSAQIEKGSIILTDHPFWNGPLHFPAFPSDLVGRLGRSDLVLLKGDLNYRRLLADRRWDPAIPMEAIVGYFPAALLALRTTKSEIVVDVRREIVQRLDSEDPNWLIEGRYGIIRYCDPQDSPGTRNSTTPVTL